MWFLLGATSSCPGSAPCCPGTNWKPCQSQATATVLFPASAGGKPTFTLRQSLRAVVQPQQTLKTLKTSLKDQKGGKEMGHPPEWPGWVGGRLLLSWGVQMLFFPCKACSVQAVMAATWER